MSDKPGIRKLREDEREFLSKLFHSEFENMAKIANIRLCNLYEAQDAVQETFLAAQNNIEKIMQSENPQGWLMNALKYSVKQQWRTKMRFELLQQEIKFNTTDTISEGSDDFELWRVLSKDEYETLRMIYIEGYTRREVADILGITYEACKKRVQSAKRKLNSEIK